MVAMQMDVRSSSVKNSFRKSKGCLNKPAPHLGLNYEILLKKRTNSVTFDVLNLFKSAHLNPTLNLSYQP
jgi:hypothetical protein